MPQFPPITKVTAHDIPSHDRTPEAERKPTHDESLRSTLAQWKNHRIINLSAHECPQTLFDEPNCDILRKYPSCMVHPSRQHPFRMYTNLNPENTTYMRQTKITSQLHVRISNPPYPIAVGHCFRSSKTSQMKWWKGECTKATA